MYWSPRAMSSAMLVSLRGVTSSAYKKNINTEYVWVSWLKVPDLRISNYSDKTEPNNHRTQWVNHGANYNFECNWCAGKSDLMWTFPRIWSVKKHTAYISSDVFDQCIVRDIVSKNIINAEINIYPDISKCICCTRILPNRTDQGMKASSSNLMFWAIRKFLYFLLILHFRLKLTSGDPCLSTKRRLAKRKLFKSPEKHKVSVWIAGLLNNVIHEEVPP